MHWGMSKLEMAVTMVNRALNKGFAADYLLADARFGSKTTLWLTQVTDLSAILWMKKRQNAISSVMIGAVRKLPALRTKFNIRRLF